MTFSIGELARRTEVKVPTIRYYEDIGLLQPPTRTAGNQRRYTTAGIERLSFIKHARALGFSLEAIAELIALQEHPDRSCQSANDIASTQLATVRDKLRRLRALEKELKRIVNGCDGTSTTDACYVITALADHSLCNDAH